VHNNKPYAPLAVAVRLGYGATIEGNALGIRLLAEAFERAGVDVELGIFTMPSDVVWNMPNVARRCEETLVKFANRRATLAAGVSGGALITNTLAANALIRKKLDLIYLASISCPVPIKKTELPHNADLPEAVAALFHANPSLLLEFVEELADSDCLVHGALFDEHKLLPSFRRATLNFARSSVAGEDATLWSGARSLASFFKKVAYGPSFMTLCGLFCAKYDASRSLGVVSKFGVPCSVFRGLDDPVSDFDSYVAQVAACQIDLVSALEFHGGGHNLLGKPSAGFREFINHLALQVPRLVDAARTSDDVERIKKRVAFSAEIQEFMDSLAASHLVPDSPTRMTPLSAAAQINPMPAFM
jgi:hypothetical protein